MKELDLVEKFIENSLDFYSLDTNCSDFVNVTGFFAKDYLVDYDEGHPIRILYRKVQYLFGLWKCFDALLARTDPIPDTLLKEIDSIRQWLKKQLQILRCEDLA